MIKPIAIIFVFALYLLAESTQAQLIAKRYRFPEFEVPKTHNEKGDTPATSFNLIQWSNSLLREIGRIIPTFETSGKEYGKVAEAVHGTLMEELLPLGFSEEQVVQFQYAAIVDLTVVSYERSRQTLALTEQNVTNSALEHGLLVVKSIPTDATIRIDQFSNFDNSNCQIVLKEGKRKISISKVGYREIEEDVTIEALKVYTLEKKLQPF